MDMNVAFSINGWMSQSIVVTDDDFTSDDVIKGLEDGTIITGMSTGAPLVSLGADGTKWKEIGVVVGSSLEDGEMFDFATG